MPLILSGAAAPGLPHRELVAAAERRGFAGVELGWPDEPGTASLDALAAALREAVGARLPLAAVRVESTQVALSAQCARHAGEAGVPVVVPAEAAASLSAEEILAAAARYAGAGALLLIGSAAEGERVRELSRMAGEAPAGALGVALEVRPGSDQESAAALIALAGTALGYVRLYGGGPETVAQGGAGVGALMARLALARFSSPLVLAPSGPGTRQAWRLWLSRNTARTGCGSAVADPSLTQLQL